MTTELKMVLLFGLGIYFVIYGVHAIIHKQIIFPLTRNTTARLSGVSARIAGISLLLAGFVMAVPTALVATNSISSEDWTTNNIGFTAIMIILIGMCLGAVLKAAGKSDG